MVTLLIVTALTGILLGMRLKVLVLIPAIASFSLVVVVLGVARGDGALAILVAAVIAASALQVGYLCGIFTKYGAAAHAGPSHQAPYHEESPR